MKLAPGDRLVVVHVALGFALACAGLLGLDRAVAQALHDSGLAGLRLFAQGTTLLDTLSGRAIWKYLLAALVGGAGLALLAARRPRIGWGLLLAALVHVLAYLVTGLAKPLFGRLRPFQLLDSGDWSLWWFAGGSAFPSGHVSFYFGLFLPLAWAFPRWRWPLLAAPWFIACARVDANDHFVSDVAASIVLVGLLTLLLARLLPPGAREGGGRLAGP